MKILPELPIQPVLLLYLMVGLQGLSQAQTYVWDGGGNNGNWAQAGNWDPNGAPPNDTTAAFVFDEANMVASPTYAEAWRPNNNRSGITFTGLTIRGNRTDWTTAWSGGWDIRGGTHTLSGNVTASGGTHRYQGTATLGADVTVNVADQSLHWTGSIAGSGSHSLTKTGAGILELTAANAYTATTAVQSGTLLINGNQSAAGGAVNIASGATLGGRGTVGGATTINGIHSPGSIVGVQTFASGLAYHSGSTLVWELTGNTVNGRGNNYDGVDVSGGTLSIAAGVTTGLVFNSPRSNVLWSDGFWNEDRSWLVFANSAPPSIAGLPAITLSVDSAGNRLENSRSRAGFSWEVRDNDIYLNYTVAQEPEVSIPGLRNTGVDSAGQPLAAGAVDPHYRLITSPNNAYGPDAFLLSGWPTEGPWIPNASSDLSRWIAPAGADPGGWFPPGLYEYETTFDLTGLDPSTVRIEGRWASDGGGSLSGIFINGIPVPNSTGGFTEWNNFAIVDSFVEGINRLVFRLNNPGTEGSPTGIRVEMSGQVGGILPSSFFSSLGPAFDEPLNRMWRLFGSVAEQRVIDGKLDNVVIRFGNEPAFFEWMARKLMWTNDWDYRSGLFSRLRDFAMSANGYVWSWGDRPDWPTDPGALHQENNAKYILSLYRYFMWTRYEGFLETRDTRTRTSVSDYQDADISQGMTMLEKMRLAMQYQLNELRGAEGLLVIENDHNTGFADGAPTNYWDNFPFGYKDAYSNAYFYASVLAMAEIEEHVGQHAQADYYRNLAATIWRRYTEEFWDLRKGRFVGTIDAAGRVRDLGFTFLNTEALVYGLGGQREADLIFSWLDGEREISTDTSKGADIYTFRWAPRATTLDVASLGTPYWWKSINDNITVHPGGNATFGEHLENGGAIFYTSHYDILARARYRGADDAWARLGVIMEEFAIDELLRNPSNNVGPRWKFGIIGVFPESGLVPASFLYGFLGIDANLQGLNIRPNLPAALDYGGVRNLAFGDGIYTVTTWKDRVEIEPAHATDRRLFGVIGNLPPNTSYRLVIHDLRDGDEVVSLGVTNAAGEFPFDLTVRQGVRISIEPAGG